MPCLSPCPVWLEMIFFWWPSDISVSNSIPTLTWWCNKTKQVNSFQESLPADWNRSQSDDVHQWLDCQNMAKDGHRMPLMCSAVFFYQSVTICWHIQPFLVVPFDDFFFVCFFIFLFIIFFCSFLSNYSDLLLMS